MWERIEEKFSGYCFGVLGALFWFVDRVHPVVAIGITAMLTAASYTFLPRWFNVGFAVFVWIPAAATLSTIMVTCLFYIRRHEASKLGR